MNKIKKGPGFQAWLKNTFDARNGYLYTKNKIRRPCYDTRDPSDMQILLQKFNALKNRGKL